MKKEKQFRNKRKPSKPKSRISKVQSPNSELRKRAELRLRGKDGDLKDLSPRESEELIHELQIHQIELEMQNKELRAAQEVIEESRAKYSDLYDFAPVGYFTFDKKGLILEVNLTGADLLQTEKGSLIRKPFSRFVHKDDQDAFYLHCQQVFKKQTRQNCEIRIIRRDKSESNAQLTSMIVQDNEGNYTHIRIAVSNITERMQAEEKLRESEEHLVEAQQIAHIGSWDWDIIKNESSWSQETFQIFGVNPKNFTPNYETFINAIHPDDREFISKAVEEGMGKDKTVEIDYRIRRLDGTERIVNSKGKVFRDKKGNPIRMAGTCQDITDRKKHEQTLSESENKFKSLYSRMTEGVALHEVIYDKLGKAIDYEIMDVNPAYEMITGLNREQALGRKASELYETGEPPYIDIYEKVAASGEPTSFDTYFPPMKKHFSISVFSPAKGEFATIFQDITERKKYEQALIKSEKKFESLHLQARQDWEDTFETIPDMITIHDRDFNLIHANRAAKEILNLPILDPKTINKCFKYYHGTGAPPEGCPSCDCYNTGLPATFEVFEPHLNRFIEIRAIPRFDKEKKLIGLIHIVRDISKRKQTEEKLRKSEKRFHAAAICTADLIWEGDIRSDGLSWFGDIDSTLGYKAGEFPRTIKGFMESIHPEDRDNVNKAVQKSIKSGRKLSVDFRMKCKKGMYRYWHESGKAVEFENKKAVKWIGSITDISARKMAEDNLIENEEKYKRLSQEFHTLLDAIPDSLILLSPDLKVLWSNAAFESKVGKKASACQDKYCYRLCCDISSPCNNCPVIKCFQSGKEEVTQVTDADGRILDKRSFPLFDDSGKVSKVIEVARDVTAKIRMEEEAKIIQSRLIHENKMTSLGALVSGVAHEINNPNSYIMSNTQVFTKIWNDAVEILKENCHDKRNVLIGGIPFPKMLELAPKLLIGINDGSVRISNIVDNLKKFSQPQRNDLDEKVNVNRVIMSSRSILDHNIKQFTHNFHVNCSENIPPARGNTQQIDQVIINLIMNALQSLPDMTSEIWVSTSHNKTSNTVEIKVKDNGVGMSDDVLQQVSDPFFTTKADTGGTGLGLSISYAIIKDHKGFMSIKSKKGKGTTVTVTLPVYNRKDLIV